ncbi:MAG: hypothetical protein HF314_04805 [Ignavibacteria bacterium]|jgi:hypothetical protein|nr:hypothetical protein [Ignavibacteria bacterium]MCU7502370.1 hypothetical protein [Ignavibacteria bacterium]MCU7515065.1 hypothetical protein [Ignavibacteria bacterium]
MKSWKPLLFVAFFSIVFYSCSKNDDSTNPIDQSSFIGLASDYMPVTANQSLKGTINGSITESDSSGAVTHSESWTGIDAEAKIGASTTHKNVNANPILGYNQERGRFDVVGYLYNNGDLMGMNINPDPQEANGLLLPKEFKIGQEWIVNSSAKINIPRIKVKAAEAMASYVTTSGKTYNNVVRFEVTSYDSVTTENTINYYSKITVIRALSGAIYLAKGIGLVDAKVDNFSMVATGKQNRGNRNENVYYKSVTKGSLSL